MTDTWAAKVLEGAPRHNAQDAKSMTGYAAAVWLHEDAVVDAITKLGARVARLEGELHNCVGMLDQLVAESGRGIEWDQEDPFRMGEWFEPEDLAQIEQARAALTDGAADGGKHE